MNSNKYYLMNINVAPTIQGFAKITQYTFSINGAAVSINGAAEEVSSVPGSNLKIRWDLGDGTIVFQDYDEFEDTSSITHIYKYAQTYVVTASVYNELHPEDKTLYATRNLIVSNAYNNSIALVSDSNVSISTPLEIKVSVTNTDTDNPTYITIHPKNSASIPKDSVPFKWSSIARKWKFTDENGNDIVFPYLINTAPCALLNDQEAVHGTTNTAAVSGEATLYYTDDSSKNGLTLTSFVNSDLTSSSNDSFTSDHFSFSNPATFFNKTINVTNLIPTGLKITENFINPIYPLKWANVTIPILVTLTSNNVDVLMHPAPSQTSPTGNTTVTLTVKEGETTYASPEYFSFGDNEKDYFLATEPGYLFTSIKISNALINKKLKIFASINFYNGTSQTTIAGESEEFTLLDANQSYTFAKINEDFNYSEYFKSLMLPQHLQNTPELDKFVAAIGGDGDLTRENLGTVLYEKIANFGINHSDYETAEITKLSSLCKQMNIDSPNFSSEFPREIERLINLFSIPKYRLRGNKDVSPDNTTLGDALTDSSVIIADEYYWLTLKTQQGKKSALMKSNYYESSPGVFNQQYSLDKLILADGTKITEEYIVYRLSNVNRIIVNDKNNEDYQPIPNSSLQLGKKYCIILKDKLGPNSLKPYEIIIYSNDPTEYNQTSLSLPLLTYYDFYEIEEQQANEYANNVIDWNSSYTNTDLFNLITYDEWYGSDQLVERAFNNLLTKRLLLE